MIDRRLAVSTAIVATIAFTGCSTLGQYVANSLYGDLDLPIDREAAITVTAFPPSSDIRAVIGGKGEGLDCSIPSILESLMFDRVSGAESPVSLQFRQGCVFHDYCYRHGYATYGYTQADCDFMLLQAAFRTCIQIYEFGLLVFGQTYASSNRPETCEARAREVLLGVRIGGWGSFKAREQSSYFEFDPLPMHADDYTIARLTRITPDKAPLVDGQHLLSTPTTFHFSRGRVGIRELRWNLGEKLGEKDIVREKMFPTNMVPTPPQVSRVGGGDWFVLINRKSDHNTGFRPLIDFSGGDSVSRDFYEPPCPKRSPTSSNPNPSPDCDFDASVIRLAPHSDRDTEAARFFAFTHRFPDRRADGKFYYTIGIHWWDLPVRALIDRTAPWPTAFSIKLAEAPFRYRFLQSEVYVGEFRKRGCREVVALGRGIHVNSESREEARAKSTIADDYKLVDAAAFIPFSTTDCPDSELRQIPLPQTAEPAVPVSREPGDTDRLLTVSTGGNGSSVQITEYTFGDAGSSKREAELRDLDRKPVVLDSSWVKSAAYVVRGGTRGDRLFFSRVTLEPEQAILFEKREGPDSVRIEFRYFEASEAGWVQRGYSSCKIDLEKQHNATPTYSQKRALYERLARESGAPRLEWEKLFRSLDKQEMVRQWKQSQVIPGYIFPADATDNERPIDAVVVYHESSDYSLLLQGKRGAAGKPDKFEVKRPAGELFAFAECD